MWTVYFDTSFFINLRDAPEDEALAVIGDLNHLQIRHVFSEVLFRELIFSTVPQEAWFQLVCRIEQLEQAPLNLGPADWLALLAPDLQRQQYAHAFRSIDEQLSASKSLSMAAGRKLDKEQRPSWKENCRCAAPTPGVRVVTVKAQRLKTARSQAHTHTCSRGALAVRVHRN